MKSKTYYVYALVNPNTDEYFYVGVTDCPERRIRDHWYNKGKSKKHEYINTHGIKPTMAILETISQPTINRPVNNLEGYWISKLMDEGHPITNKPIVFYNSLYPH